MLKILASIMVLSVLVNAAPTPDPQDIPPLISFKNGRVGVNFLGFKASAGLGGILTGNAADGGLHASAETPYGQRAAAGLGGVVDGAGRSAGGLYAGATAGGGVQAGAGLGGSTGAGGSVGGSFAGASNGVSATNVAKYSEKAIDSPVSVTKEVHVASAPVYQKTVEVVQTNPKPAYIEKTIQVPTFVEKTIRVPVQSTQVETRYSEEVSPGSIKVVQKVKHHPHHRKVHYKYVNYGYGAPFFGFAGGFGPAISAGAGLGAGAGVDAGASVGAVKVASAPVSSSYTVTKTANPQFFNDIFNIPISTLGAVNQFLNGISSGTSGSVAVSKHVSVG